MVAIVTGASGGIGKAICQTLARDGYDIVLLAQDRATLTKGAKALQHIYPKQHFYTAVVDLEKPQEIRTFFLRKDMPFSQVTVLVNNAGVSIGDDIFSISEKDWDTSLAVNLKAPFLLMREIIRWMKKYKLSGSIINIASIAAFIGAKKPNYAASKAGLIGLTKAVARSVGQYNIRVNAIAPGAVDTDLIADWNEHKRKEVISQTVLKKIARPEEIAETVSFLASQPCALPL
ncbi:MAG: SDR family NAD(P)-dependent oxidoreductase [Candidatus Gottesmanbacteria bacterium]|nr:SDR family NAD(P)-dependent oxidoreductase [Candidatus Gottesmanbacteria bacterium]